MPEMRSAAIVAVLFLLSVCMSQACAATCGSTTNLAGCVGPNGAATYNKNTGQAGAYNKNTGQLHTAQPYNVAPGVHVRATTSAYNYNYGAPGTHVQTSGGNSATKALQPGCAWANGTKVCN